MIGALISSAVLWILMVTMAKDEMFSYRQAFLAVVISGMARFLVFTLLAEAGQPILLAHAAGIAVGLLPLFLYLNHLGYNGPLIVRVLLYFVLIGIVMSGVHFLMDWPVDLH